MKKKKKTIIGLTILIIAVIAFFMIFNFKSKNKLEKTSLRLKWVCQAQFAGYYSALKEGYYKDVGLSVTIDPAGPNISPIQSVTSGVNEFGIAGAEQIITAIDNKVPIVAIAVIYRETPEALVSKKELNIKAPKDLEGKTVGVVYENDENLYRLFLKKNNVDENSIKEVPAITGISQVMTDQVDAKMAYEMNDAILLELEGEKVNLLRFRDYGVKVYADTIFTTKEMVEKHPDKVKKFLKASLKGWNYAIENPEKSVSQLIEINPTLKYEHQLGYLKGSIPLIMTDEKIGVSDSKIWENMIDNLYENKMIKKKIKASEVYTNEFLK
ncbi:MAG: ABC transporter substrate-binding protein [Bacilli bacterium]|nr:ABC transporter substrate-binding protein [Bacilli bacterium]